MTAACFLPGARSNGGSDAGPVEGRGMGFMGGGMPIGPLIVILLGVPIGVLLARR